MKKSGFAQHVADKNCVAEFRYTGVFLGEQQVKLEFANGERTTMSEHRFNQLFNQLPEPEGNDLSVCKCGCHGDYTEHSMRAGESGRSSSVIIR